MERGHEGSLLAKHRQSGREDQVRPRMDLTPDGQSLILRSPSMTAPTLTVVIMAYNEAASLGAVWDEIQTELERTGVTYEILLVDDGSTDGTAEICDALAKVHPIGRVIHHRPNQGLGGVYRTGFREARGTWLTFFPADGQFPATIIGQYLAHLDGTDMILGYLPERDGPLTGKLLSLAERRLFRALFGYFPKFQGILMFRRSLLDKHPLVSQGRGWTVLMEFILRATRGGAIHTSLPIQLRPRQSGHSKVNNLRSVASNLRQVLALWRRL